MAKKMKRSTTEDESSPGNSASSSEESSREETARRKRRRSQARRNTAKKKRSYSQDKEIIKFLAEVREEVCKQSKQVAESKEEVSKQLEKLREEMCKQSKQVTESKEEMYKQLDKLREEMCKQSKQVTESKEEMYKQLDKLREEMCKQSKQATESKEEICKQLERVNQDNQEMRKEITEILTDLHKQWDHHTNGSSGDDSDAPRSQSNQVQPPRYRLVFKSGAIDKIDKGQPFDLSVALVDGNDQTVENGPLASATVELVVVKAEFNQHNNQYNWSREDFESNIKKAQQGNSATVDVDQSLKSIVSDGRFNLVQGVKCHSGSKIFRNSGNKKVRLGVMVVSPTEERVLEGLSNPFYVRGHDRLRHNNRSNMQRQSLVDDGYEEQNGTMPNTQNPPWANSTQSEETNELSALVDGNIWNPDFMRNTYSVHAIGTPFYTHHRTCPVRIILDTPSMVPSKHCFNLLDQPKFYNCGLRTAHLMQEHFGSLTTMQKEVMQTRRERGVLIEPLESDDSDEGRPLKRNLHSKYQLRFVNKVCGAYYTRDQIQADDGNLLKVALFDENNTNITSGPLSSLAVEVVALHGDFNGDSQDDWTSEEFSRSIVFPSLGEEASSVLGGDCILVLAGGEACLSNAFFQKASFCARTGMFKMGVMLASAQEERIQEGISEPFWVMDQDLPGFISNCWSWKSDLEPLVCEASIISAKTTEAVFLAASKIGSILKEEATKADISKLSEKVDKLKEVPRKIKEIGKELNMMIDKVIKQKGTTSLTNELVKGWISEGRHLCYHVEDVIDKYSYYAIKMEEENRVKKIFTKAQYIRLFSEITEEITQIEKKLENVVKWKDRWLQQSQLSPNLFADIERKRSEIAQIENKLENVVQHNGRWLQQSQLSPNLYTDIERKWSQDCILDVVRDDLVGIEENRRLLTEWLSSDEQSPKLITVSGMGGLGKTSLVTDVYEREKNNFDVYDWIVASQTYDVVELLRKLLRNIEGTQQTQQADLDTYDLKRKIKERLTGRKCLIVLDDLWNEETYSQIRDAFQNLKASCVIITARQERVAALAHSTHQLKLKPLGYSDAYSLFCRKAFYNCVDSKCPNELEKLAHKIVDRCQGLPLAILTMGGLLSARTDVRNEKLTQFQDVLNRDDQDESNESIDKIGAILSFSYNDLPGCLRNCLLYLSLFPKGHLISRESIVRLWVAQGFAFQNEQSTPEEVADKYLRELIQRNMLQAIENDGLGSTYKMYDLVHEHLAISFGRDEKFGFASEYGTMVKIDKSVRRLSSCGWKDKTSSLKYKIQLPHLQTLVAHGITESSPELLSLVFSQSKYLTVLDLQDSEIVEFPVSIGNLFNLRYIGLRRTRVKSLPESIGKLCNLQTLDIKQTKLEKLPRGIAKVKKLQHLLADRYADAKQSEFRYLTGVQAPKELSNLVELQTLETVEASKDLAEQLRKLKKLRSVWIDNIISGDCASIFTALSKMPLLSSLLLSASNEKETLCLEALKPQSKDLHKLIIRGCWADRTLECSIFQEHGKYLKYLDISWCHLQEDPLQLLAPCVPNLTYLSLYRVNSASTLVLSSGCFPQMKELVLKRMPCVDEVDIRVGALRQIEGLYIESLVKLDKIPQGIESLCSLKKLRLLNLHKDFRAQWSSKGMPQKMQHVQDLCI